MYITYDEYKTYGGVLDDAAFLDVCYDAQMKLDYYTYGRLKNDTAFSENVKRLLVKIIELLQKLKVYEDMSMDITTPVVASGGNDGVSVSYGGLLGATSPQDMELVTKKINKEIRSLCLEYLLGEKNQDGDCLMYRGVF